MGIEAGGQGAGVIGAVGGSGGVDGTGTGGTGTGGAGTGSTTPAVAAGDGGLLGFTC
ncbi:hypothetical protein [Actinopolymorpha pittospori]|uniref:Uncharacterized protein n=1 Tax=Actinopolymorpha pittospori TaxID=648752 RepID=A0A927N5P8_9ACTN|nr:hypothetical protein [Actinopolymorpha pittospori]